MSSERTKRILQEITADKDAYVAWKTKTATLELRRCEDHEATGDIGGACQHLADSIEAGTFALEILSRPLSEINENLIERMTRGHLGIGEMVVTNSAQIHNYAPIETDELRRKAREWNAQRNAFHSYDGTDMLTLQEYENLLSSRKNHAEILLNKLIKEE